MNGVTLTQDQKRIYRLEKCIKDFKAYDAERKTYVSNLEAKIEQLESKNNRLQLKCESLADRIDALIDAYDKADPMKDGSERRAYVKELLDRLAGDKPGKLTSRRLELIDSALAKEVIALRKGNERLNAHNRELEKELQCLISYNPYDANRKA